jgi:hypothetical protein
MTTLAPRAVPRVLVHGVSAAQIAELRDLGLVVVDGDAFNVGGVGGGAGVDADPVAGWAEHAGRVGAFAALVHDSGSARIVSAGGAAYPVDVDADPVAVAERVRALLLVESLKRTRTVIVTQQAPPAPPPPPPTQFRVGVDGRAVAFVGAPAVVGVDVTAAVRPVPFLDVGVAVAVPVAPVVVVTDDIAVSSFLSAAFVTVGVPLRLHPRLEVAAELGVGPLWLASEGKGAGNVVGRSENTVVATAQLDALARVRVVSSLWLEGGVRLAALTPRPVFVVDDRAVAAVGNVGVGFVFGVSGSFPEADLELDPAGREPDPRAPGALSAEENAS